LNRAEETTLVWSLIDVTRSAMTPTTRVWLCAKIGAGEQEEAMTDLLNALADRSVSIPGPLTVPLWNWVWGYRGSDREPALRALLSRLHVPEPPRPTAPPTEPSVPRRPPFNQRPRRVPPSVARPASFCGTHADPARFAEPRHNNGLRCEVITVSGSNDGAYMPQRPLAPTKSRSAS
jgi:hypothetical protein